MKTAEEMNYKISTSKQNKVVRVQIETTLLNTLQKDNFRFLILFMQQGNADSIKIVNTTKDDLETIFWLFNKAMELQGKNGYTVWNSFDKIKLEKEIESNHQYKIMVGEDISCIFKFLF